MNHLHKYAHEFPTKQMIWLPTFNGTACEFMYRFYFVLYHYVPALLIDLVMKIKGSKTRLFGVYNKIFYQLKLLEYFMMRTWVFNDINMRSLYNQMSEQDHEEFHVRITSEAYEPHGRNCVEGFRRYFFKENDEDLKIAKSRYKLFYVLHNTLLAIFYGILLYFLYAFVN